MVKAKLFICKMLRESVIGRGKPQQQVIVIPTHIIVDLYLDFMALKQVQYLTRGIFNINQALQNIQIHPIELTNSDCDYIVDVILRQDKIDYERNINDEYYAE